MYTIDEVLHTDLSPACKKVLSSNFVAFIRTEFSEYEIEISDRSNLENLYNKSFERFDYQLTDIVAYAQAWMLLLEAGSVFEEDEQTGETFSLYLEDQPLVDWSINWSLYYENNNKDLREHILNKLFTSY